jgi:hypothetical protein
MIPLKYCHGREHTCGQDMNGVQTISITESSKTNHLVIISVHGATVSWGRYISMALYKCPTAI